MTTIVHGIQLSPFARKVILALEAKGVAFTINPVTPMEKPEGFEVLSPLGKVPAFEDDQLAISDSSVICEYIDQRYPQTPLYPEDLVARARVRWFEEYSDSAVLAVIGPIFFERLVKTALLQQTSDEARVEEVIANQLPAVFDYLESQLAEHGFLVGETVSMADIALGSHLMNASYVGVDTTGWPKLSAYRDRLFATELFANRLAADKAMIAG